MISSRSPIVVSVLAVLLLTLSCSKESLTGPPTTDEEYQTGDLVLDVRSTVGLKVRGAYVTLKAEHWPDDSGLPGLDPDGSRLFTKLTDSNGLVTFSNYETGTHELRIVAAGYLQLQSSVTIVADSVNQMEVRVGHSSDAWVTGANYSTDFDICAVAAIGGKLYVPGIHYNYVGDYRPGVLWIYNPALDEWSSGSPIPAPRYRAVPAVWNGKMIVIGGYSLSDSSYTVEIYDPVLDVWESRSPAPVHLSYSSGEEIDGKIYIAGGGPAEVMIYEPDSDLWSTGAPMSVPRTSSATGVINGKLYLAGGSIRRPLTGGGWGSEDTDVVEVYDPVLDSWSSCSPLPQPWDGGLVGVLDEILFLAGGGQHGLPYSQLLSFDPMANGWSQHAGLLDARSWCVGAVIGSQFYVLNGGNMWANTQIQNQVYTP